MLTRFDPKEKDIVSALERTDGVLAFAHGFLYSIIGDDDAWETNREAFDGLANVLFELRFELRDLAKAINQPVVEIQDQTKRGGFNMGAEPVFDSFVSTVAGNKGELLEKGLPIGLSLEAAALYRVRGPMKTPGEVLSALETAVMKEMQLALANPDLLCAAFVERIKRAIDLLEEMRGAREFKVFRKNLDSQQGDTDDKSAT